MKGVYIYVESKKTAKKKHNSNSNCYNKVKEACKVVLTLQASFLLNSVYFNRL